MYSIRAVLLGIVAIVATGCASFDLGRTAREDGRFTIGASGHRLMYGYPIPYSTSHFVVSVDGKYASNSPHFPTDIEYLSGSLTTKGEPGSPTKEITFRFGEVDIKQRLVPVDKNLNELAPGGFGRYYRIEYEIENYGQTTHTVGLSLLIDTMIDDNDASQMDADGTRIARQTQFDGRRVPDEVLVYRVAGNLNETTGSLITAKSRGVRPDVMAVGRWPYFHSVVWDFAAQDAEYTDSAILLRWNEQPIAPRAMRYIATYYGLRNEGQISVLTNAENFKRDSASVYFDLGKSNLTDGSRASIDNLVSGRTVAGAFVEVHADAVGDVAKNLALSKKRADAVRDYLRTKSIPAEIIIPKSYGESFADQSATAREKGRQEDRRATI
ncbi:MAG: OmpA family protein, partial [bacterium]|nr:OmpA family protein [Candidatus Kapabacteria bacterium]